MRRVFERTVRTMGGVLAGLLLAAFTLPLSAQPVAGAAVQRPVLGYDRAHEITLNATIQSVVTKAATGSPAGMHLMVTSPQGNVDAHLGPYLSKETIRALHAGTEVQMIGATEKVHGRSYLLVRQLIFSGRLVKVRNENGFLVRMQNPRPARATGEKVSQVNGGLR